MEYAALGVAGAVGGTGFGLYTYNRENFSFDAKMRYSRFIMTYNQACGQQAVYREDITDLTMITVKRMDIYATVCVISLTCLIALFCPGRLALHGPAPPSWLMGLFLTNLAMSMMWIGITLWLAMHASLRAETAAVHMLTRWVRLPVPTQAMLDKARVYFSDYEKQPFREIFRFPFTKHPKRGNEAHAIAPDGTRYEEDASSRMRTGQDMPAWLKQERLTDDKTVIEQMMPLQARGQAPEHFEAFREIQNEWWPFDTYARIGTTLIFMHLFHAWSYYQIGHTITEIRSVWTTMAVITPFSAIQQIILSLDVKAGFFDLPIHRLGPFAQYFGYVAMALEYKRWYTSSGAALAWICVFIAYLIHIVYTIQLIRLAAPDYREAPEKAEAAGAAWWPKQWRLPTAFNHAMWLVAPPRLLEPGLNDIVSEVRGKIDHNRGTNGVGNPTLSMSRRRDVQNAFTPQVESAAWRYILVGLLASVFAWVWLTVGFAIDVINQGTAHPSVLNAPGNPNWNRDIRWRPLKPNEPARYITEFNVYPSDIAARNEYTQEVAEDQIEAGYISTEALVRHQERSSSAGHHRRLQEDVSAPLSPDVAIRKMLANRLRNLLPHLQELAGGSRESEEVEKHANDVDAVTQPTMQGQMNLGSAGIRLPVSWPPLFEPRLLASGPGGVLAAFSRHGRGVIVKEAVLGKEAREIASTPSAEVIPFVIEGIAQLGPLLAASWDDHGLLLLTQAGVAVECPGQGPVAGRLRCKSRSERLPIGASSGVQARVRAAALARAEGGKLRAALVFDGESSVVLFASHGDSGSWLPAGEARMPNMPTAIAFSGEDALLLASEDGSATRLQISDGKAALASSSAPGSFEHVWEAICGLGDGGVTRLGLKKNSPQGYLAVLIKNA